MQGFGAGRVARQCTIHVAVSMCKVGQGHGASCATVAAVGRNTETDSDVYTLCILHQQHNVICVTNVTLRFASRQVYSSAAGTILIALVLSLALSCTLSASQINKREALFQFFCGNAELIYIKTGMAVECVNSSKFCRSDVLKMFGEVCQTARYTLSPPRERLAKRIRLLLPEFDWGTIKVIDCGDMQQCSVMSGQEEAKRRYFFAIVKALCTIDEGSDLLLLGYCLLTQFNVAIVYMLCHAFQQTTPVPPNILTQNKQWQICRQTAYSHLLLPAAQKEAVLTGETITCKHMKPVRNPKAVFRVPFCQAGRGWPTLGYHLVEGLRSKWRGIKPQGPCSLPRCRKEIGLVGLRLTTKLSSGDAIQILGVILGGKAISPHLPGHRMDCARSTGDVATTCYNAVKENTLGKRYRVNTSRLPLVSFLHAAGRASVDPGVALNLGGRRADELSLEAILSFLIYVVQNLLFSALPVGSGGATYSLSPWVEADDRFTTSAQGSTTVMSLGAGVLRSCGDLYNYLIDYLPVRGSSGKTISVKRVAMLVAISNHFPSRRRVRGSSKPVCHVACTPQCQTDVLGRQTESRRAGTKRGGAVVTHWTRIRGTRVQVPLRRMMGWVPNKGHGQFLPQSLFPVQLVPSLMTLLSTRHNMMTHSSARSASVASDLFKYTFTDSDIAKKFQMHKDKLGYVVAYGLGPFFQKELSIVKDLLMNFISAFKERGLNLKTVIQVSVDEPYVNVKFLKDEKLPMRRLSWAGALLPHLKKYINVVGKKPPQSENLEKLKVTVKDELLAAKLEFLSSISVKLESFLTDCQTNWLRLPFVYTDLNQLIVLLMNKIVNHDILSTAISTQKLIGIDLAKKCKLKTYQSLDIGFAASTALKEVKEILALQFEKNCQAFLVELCPKLMKKCPLSYKTCQGCKLPFPRSNDEIKLKKLTTADLAKREYLDFLDKQSIQEQLKNFNFKNDRDHFMYQLLANENVLKALLSFVQKILILFHANGAVEHSFSINKQCLVENLLEDSLVAQRSIYDAVISAGSAKRMFKKKRVAEEIRVSELKKRNILQHGKEEAEALESQVGFVRPQRRDSALIFCGLRKNAEFYKSIMARIASKLEGMDENNSVLSVLPINRLCVSRLRNPASTPPSPSPRAEFRQATSHLGGWPSTTEDPRSRVLRRGFSPPTPASQQKDVTRPTRAHHGTLQHPKHSPVLGPPVNHKSSASPAAAPCDDYSLRHSMPRLQQQFNTNTPCYYSKGTGIVFVHGAQRELFSGEPHSMPYKVRNGRWRREQKTAHLAAKQRLTLTPPMKERQVERDRAASLRLRAILTAPMVHYISFPPHVRTSQDYYPVLRGIVYRTEAWYGIANAWFWSQGSGAWYQQYCVSWPSSTQLKPEDCNTSSTQSTTQLQQPTEDLKCKSGSTITSHQLPIRIPFPGNKVSTPDCVSGQNSGGMKGQGKREIPEKTCRPTASSGAIPICENSYNGTGRIERERRLDCPLSLIYCLPCNAQISILHSAHKDRKCLATTQQNADYFFFAYVTLSYLASSPRQTAQRHALHGPTMAAYGVHISGSAMHVRDRLGARSLVKQGLQDLVLALTVCLNRVRQATGLSLTCLTGVGRALCEGPGLGLLTRWVDGGRGGLASFSLGSSVFLAPSFQRSILTSITLIGSVDLVVKSCPTLLHSLQIDQIKTLSCVSCRESEQLKLVCSKRLGLPMAYLVLGDLWCDELIAVTREEVSSCNHPEAVSTFFTCLTSPIPFQPGKGIGIRTHTLTSVKRLQGNVWSYYYVMPRGTSAYSADTFSQCSVHKRSISSYEELAHPGTEEAVGEQFYSCVINMNHMSIVEHVEDISELHAGADDAEVPARLIRRRHHTSPDLEELIVNDICNYSGEHIWFAVGSRGSYIAMRHIPIKKFRWWCAIRVCTLCSRFGLAVYVLCMTETSGPGRYEDEPSIRLRRFEHGYNILPSRLL
ncbi:hypothetical protein PR048_018376 [Dryococelus australis]|uniref:Uncharacterized protein n=1 Tax=Dryococelus australis TaxID=614101 RepID=A0ABQ9HCB8_9NEOP|nr:hypothetical protein PR048_018376 [Dryococelus australis]